MTKARNTSQAAVDDVEEIRDRGAWDAPADSAPHPARDFEADADLNNWQAQVQLDAPAGKQDVHIRLDREVLDWFRGGGPGYQTRINSVLRAFVRARRAAGQEFAASTSAKPQDQP